MKAQGIRIVRYADDILIFARSSRQAEYFRDLAVKVLEGDLKLVVNREKTHLAELRTGVSFLGFVIHSTYVAIHPKRIKRFKNRIRELIPRNHGKNVESIIHELNQYLRGWINYYRIANCRGWLNDMMQWIRRRLRMKQMCEWKSWKALHRALRRNGYKGDYEKISMRRWRNSASPLVNMALPNIWFDRMGLFDLCKCEIGILHRYWE